MRLVVILSTIFLLETLNLNAQDSAKVTNNDGYNFFNSFNIDFPVKDSFNLHLNDMYVKVRIGTGRINTNNFMPKKQLSIEINYYFKNDILEYVEAFQKCFLKDTKESYSRYYFDNDVVIKEQFGTITRKGFNCIGLGIRDILNESETCNNRLDKVFQKEYIISLLNKIQTSRHLSN